MEDQASPLVTRFWGPDLSLSRLHTTVVGVVVVSKGLLGVTLGEASGSAFDVIVVTLGLVSI